MKPRIHARHPAIEALESGIHPAVYAVELSTGVIKVGHSAVPKSRLLNIANLVRRKYGAQIVNVFVGPEFSRSGLAHAAESDLLASMRSLGTVVGTTREYFVGVTFAQAVTKAQAACATQLKRMPAIAPRPNPHCALPRLAAASSLS